uniref:Contactin 1 n=1 Tax=Pavo cristatus TaxID=9049 RepID=A0A8C9G437_PAVCR
RVLMYVPSLRRLKQSETLMWKLNNWDIDLTKDRYSMVGGRLVINNPEKSRDAGKYVCVVSNIFGTVRSSEATLSFGCKPMFMSKPRNLMVSLKCPVFLHYDLSYRWLLNEFPVFIALDRRRFVSQTNGNLYIANVEASDKGNYSCFVSSPSITKSVFSKFIPLIPQADRKYLLEILSAYYILRIKWQVLMPIAHLFLSFPHTERSKSLYCVLFCFYSSASPEWVEHINDTEKDIGSDLYWPCVATGKPIPTIRWLKNGVSFRKGELRIQSLTFEDAGMYQCIAENTHGIIYANAELKIVASPPTFELNPMKKKILAAKGGRVIIECKPKAAPKPKFSWSKGTELLVNGSRIHIWDDGSLEIINVTKLDEGRYTCFAENNRGKANSTGVLEMTGKPLLCICLFWESSSSKSLIFTPGIIKSNGELLIKNVQLRHAGRYTCTAQTIVDNSSASADLVVRGPPGPPGGIRIEEIRDTAVALTWSRGTDNHSPISKYTIQSKTFLSEEWKDAKTGILVMSASEFGTRYCPVSALSTFLFPAVGEPEVNTKIYKKEQVKFFSCFFSLFLLLLELQKKYYRLIWMINECLNF